ncbi:hypothetical protein [Burkholderia pseudomallei]|uniref:hypothetical protein n=1 Tax=Burkholderia pseudomallei TaxID=28450 RepID=UPI0012B82A54|nr:hypothetical protein [Burkholderia pseudomallei]MBM5620389.1 hypothetical protein [Burkholderia pseudomallei]MBM5634785.1 hypothetical protein [Burkholderia pseudomallei]MBM5663181.1 hypothetical protein [Burkholderia pseudomallei]
MKRHIFGFTVVMVAVACVAGCQPRKGEEFLGRWKQLHPDQRFGADLVIERGDDGFIVTSCRFDTKNQCDSAAASSRVPATLVSGMLQINMGIGAITIVYDPKTQHLQFRGDENVRVADK